MMDRTDLVSVRSVELQVKRPLMPVRLSPEQVGLEMLCLCGQLDLLIRAQMQQVGAECVTSTAAVESPPLSPSGFHLFPFDCRGKLKEKTPT